MLGWNGDGLLGGGERALGQGLDGRVAAAREVAHEALRPAARSSAGVTKRISKCSGPLVVRSRVRFQAGEDANQQVVHPGKALGLRLDQVAAPTDQQPDLEVEFGRRLDRAQIVARADLVGDGASVARVGLVLAADGALAGTVDGQPGT